MATQAAMKEIRPTLSAIHDARRFLASYLAPTRLVPAPSLSRVTGRRVYLKLETDLPTASFKVRGVLYALKKKLERGPIREVVASSTGNHGAAVAYAASVLGVKATIMCIAASPPRRASSATTKASSPSDADRVVQELCGKSVAMLGESPLHGFFHFVTIQLTVALCS